MNEAEKNIIARFLEDAFMVETVKKVLIKQFSFNKLQKLSDEHIYSNEKLGAGTRAIFQARDIIDQGFQEMEKYRHGKETPEKVNEAE